MSRRHSCDAHAILSLGLALERRESQLSFGGLDQALASHLCKCGLATNPSYLSAAWQLIAKVLWFSDRPACWESHQTVVRVPEEFPPGCMNLVDVFFAIAQSLLRPSGSWCSHALCPADDWYRLRRSGYGCFGHRTPEPQKGSSELRACPNLLANTRTNTEKMTISTVSRCCRP